MNARLLFAFLFIVFSKFLYPQYPAVDWARSLGISSTFSCSGIQTKTDLSNNIIVTGYFQGTIDLDGNPTQVMNITSYPGGMDFFIAKYTSTGTLLWAKNIGGAANEYLYGIDIDSQGNIYFTGHYQGTIDFDPGPGVTNLAPQNNWWASYIEKLDPSGNLIWVKNITSSAPGNSIMSYALKIDNGDNVIISGSLSGTMDVDPGPGVTNLVASSNCLFIAKYTSGGVLTWASASQGNGNCSGKVLYNDNLDNIYLGGVFTGTVDFNPTPASVTYTATSGPVIFLEKFDASGNFLFVKTLISGSNNSLNGITVDSNKNVVLTGYFMGLQDFDPAIATATVDAGSNGKDIFVAKYDSLGNYIFAFNVGDFGSNEGRAVATDNAGDIYVSGYFQGTCDFDPGAATLNVASSLYSSDIFVAKYSAAGNLIYARKMGSQNADEGYGLSLLSNGDFAITGIFSDNADFDPSVSSYTLTPSLWNATNKLGVFVAAYSQGTCNLTFALSSRDYWQAVESINSIKSDAAGNIYLCGYFNGAIDMDISPSTSYYLISAGWQDGFVAKYTSAGALLWARRVGGTGSDECTAISIDPQGRCIVTGYFENTATFNAALTATATSAGARDCFIMSINPAGVLLWHQTLGTTANEGGISIATNANSDIVLTGYFETNVDLDPSANSNVVFNNGGRDIFLAQFDNTGAFLWGGSMGSSTDDNPYSVAVDNNGDIVLVGTFSGFIDFDWNSSAVVTHNCSGFTDIFMAKYSPPGFCQWAHKFGSSGVDVGRCVTVDPTTNDYIMCGNFQNTVDFNPAPLVTNSLSYSSGGYIARYSSTGTYSWALGNGNTAPYAVVTDVGSNVYVTGGFFGSGNLGGPMTFNSPTSDIFIAKHTVSGAYVWGGVSSGGDQDWGLGILVDNNNDVYNVGVFRSVADVDFTSAGTYNLYADNTYDSNGFISKYKQCATYSVGVSSQTNVTCVGGNNAAATVTTTGSGVTYSWTPGNYTTAILSGLSAGTYTCLAYSSCGLATSATLTIGSPVPLNTFINASGPACQGSTLTLYGAVSGGTGPYTYTWSTGSNSSNIIMTATSSVAYSLTVSDSFGCTKTKTTTINPIATPTVTITASSTSVCAGNNVTLTAGGASTYTWSSGLSSANWIITPNTTNTYSFVGNTSGCTDTESITITVNQPSLNVQTLPATICAGDAATLTVSGAQSYSWSTGVSNNSISVSSPITNYTVSGIDGFGCTGSLVVSPVVNPIPTVNIVSTAPMLCSGGSATLNASGATSYTWNTGAVNNMIVVSPTTSTSYTIDAQSMAGCFSSTVFTQNVSTCTGGEEIFTSNNQITIYPNPGSGLFSVYLSNNAEKVDIKIYSLLGQTLITQSIIDGTTSFDLREFCNGIYLIQVYKDKKLLGSLKVIKN